MQTLLLQINMSEFVGFGKCNFLDVIQLSHNVRSTTGQAIQKCQIYLINIELYGFEFMLKIR